MEYDIYLWSVCFVTQCHQEASVYRIDVQTHNPSLQARARYLPIVLTNSGHVPNAKSYSVVARVSQQVSP